MDFIHKKILASLFIQEILISLSSKKVIKQDIPFMNGEYDFSELYGED